MSLQASPRRAAASVGAARWPYRVVSVESASCQITLSAHNSLLQHGIDLHPYPDGTAALLNLSAEDPAAVLAPTDMAGVDFLHFVRAVVSWADVPIIVGLTADEASHRLAFQALDGGARALVALPFAPEQLSSAIHHVGLRHTAPATPIRFGALALDREAHRVSLAGTPLHLSPKEFSLVEYLLNEAPRVVSVGEVAAILGDGTDPASIARVRKYVQRVRRRFTREDVTQPNPIETVRGLGYRIRLDEPADRV